MSAVGSESIEAMVHPDTWLAEAIGVDTYRIQSDAPSRLIQNPDIRQHIRALKQKPCFLYGKVDVSDPALAAWFTQTGFRLIDTNVLFSRTTEPTRGARDCCTVSPADASDEAPVVHLAETNFEYSRFHLDPELPNAIANRIKGKWMRSFFAGTRGDHLLVARVGEHVAGFVLLIEKHPTELIIDLIAVDRGFRRRGVAVTLVDAAARYGHSRSILNVCVGTQLANMPSIQLYERLGFRLRRASYVFHDYHNGRNLA